MSSLADLYGLTVGGRRFAERCNQGRSDGVDIGIYTPPKSAKVNFLWGKNDVRMAIQQFYPPPKTFIPPQNKFLATTLAAIQQIGLYKSSKRARNDFLSTKKHS